MEKMTLLNDSLAFQKTNAKRTGGNGAKTWKLWIKQGCKDLVAIDQGVKGQQRRFAEDNKVIKLLHTLQGSRERKN